MPIAATWRITDGMGCSIQGNADIVNILDTATAIKSSEDIETQADETPSDFVSAFADISDLHGGLYNVILSAIITHEEYGEFAATMTRTHAFTTAYPGVPGISVVSLSFPGRYVGAHINIAVTTRLFNILAGDQLRYELREGSHVIHSFTTANLANAATTNIHTIPAMIFVDLRTGMYSVVVTSMREGAVRQSVSVPYEVVQPPTLHFVSIDPNDIVLPIESPMDINASLFVNGRGITSVQGLLELRDTPYTAEINIDI